MRSRMRTKYYLVSYCILFIILFSQNLNEKYNVNVPIVLMNSRNTDDETRHALKKYKGVFYVSCYTCAL